MTTLFSSILPGNGDTYEGLDDDDDDSEDRADDDDGTDDEQTNGDTDG